MSETMKHLLDRVKCIRRQAQEAADDEERTAEARARFERIAKDLHLVYVRATAGYLNDSIDANNAMIVGDPEHVQFCGRL